MELLQLLQAKITENPYLIVPTLILGFFLLKFLTFAAKIVFMPYGINVKTQFSL